MPTGALGTETRFRNMLVEADGFASEIATGTASSAAVTINAYVGIITSEALTTGEGVAATITLTNNKIAAGDIVFANLAPGTNTAGMPMLAHVTVSASTCVFTFQNIHAADDLNGTIKIFFEVRKAL